MPINLADQTQGFGGGKERIDCRQSDLWAQVFMDIVSIESGQQANKVH
jgi:hypothetical protein